MPAETVIPNPDAPSIAYRQSLSPNYLRSTFVIDDTDTHYMRFDGRGKGRLAIIVDIGNSTSLLTVAVYGMPDDTAVVGDRGVIQIGNNWTVTAAEDRDYETVNDPFPFYMVSVYSAAADAGNSTCSVHANFVG